MSKEINGHEIATDVSSHYQGKTVKKWCVNPGCFLFVKGEYHVGETAAEVAQDNDCPYMNPCVRCGHPISYYAEICKSCSYEVGSKNFSKDEEGDIVDYEKSMVLYDLRKEIEEE